MEKVPSRAVLSGEKFSQLQAIVPKAVLFIDSSYFSSVDEEGYYLLPLNDL